MALVIGNSSFPNSPRDLSQLTTSKAGPFFLSLNDADCRAKLGALMTTSSKVNAQECNNTNRNGNAQCADAYGAAIVSVEEVK